MLVLMALCDGFGRVFLCVDALDEWSPEDQRPLLLQKLLWLRGRDVCVFVSSVTHREPPEVCECHHDIAEAMAGMGRRNYYMDITGPHPASFRRRLVVTAKGYLCLAADHVQPDDVVVIMMGGQMPLVLRQVQQHHVLIGEAYIDGIMDGEALVERNANGEDAVFTIH